MSTKLRVVFDASAKSTTNISLNDTLSVGPTVQADLIAIVIHFRCHNVVLVADLEKMYRQVNVSIEDTSFQRILWRPNEDDSIQIYELTTVTQGTASAPFLATRSLLQLANDEKDRYPNAAATIKTDFYVDDLLTGACDVETAKQLKQELIKLLNAGGFRLHKWTSNNEEIVSNNMEITENNIEFDDQTRKLLGLYWTAKEDILSYKVKAFNEEKRVTKCNILSQVAQLFDPLGLLGPIIVHAKLIMQAVEVEIRLG